MQALVNNPALTSHLESQINFITELSLKACDSARQLGELNLHLAQQMLDDSIGLGRSLLQCSDPFQLTTTTIAGMQPAADHLRGFQQQLMGVLAGAQVDLSRSAQAHLPEASRSATAMADDMVRSAAASASAAAGAVHSPS